MAVHTTASAQAWLRRLDWLVLIWGASVLALGIVASLFRVVMTLAGLSVKLKNTSHVLPLCPSP
jgi:Protein of unknown function (DUF2474)